MSATSPALWYVGDGKIAVRPGAVVEGPGHVLMRALFSGLSRGTERLVAQGRVPVTEHTRMRCPFQEGDFPFPVKYGYALVGEIVDGAHKGKTAFVLHPHQREISVPADAVHVLPADVPPRRAILTANMETALNVIWDSGVSAGDRVAIVGAGIVGLLISALAARMPGAQVTVIDRDPARAEIASRIGAQFADADIASENQDVVIHASGAPDGLATAMRLAGDEATVVEASWYGSTPVPLALGEAFHARRLKLISSQVGALPVARRPRWSYRRRLEAALDLLRDPMFDQFITAEIAFTEAADKVPAALASSGGLMTALRY